jgi:putative transposase
MGTGTGDGRAGVPARPHSGVPLTRPTTFRFTLDPTAAQHEALMSHAGAARLAFNHQIARVYANMDQRAAERSYGVDTADLTPALSWSKFSLVNHMNRWKDGRAPDAPTTVTADGNPVRGLAWRGEVSADVFETASVNAAQALANWSTSMKGARSAPDVRRPRFKSRRRTAPAFRLRAKYKEGALPAVRAAGPRALHLPKLGDIKIRETTRRLRRMLDGRLHVYAAAFTYRNGRWHVAVIGVAAELHHAARGARGKHDRPVGVDVGVKTLAVCADTDGAVLHRFEAVKHLQHAQARLRALAKVLSRTKKGSAGNTKARRRLGRLHARVANLRDAAIHNVTTTLAKQCGALVMEDLNVAGMVKNHHLARAVSDAAFGEIRRQLEYKTAWYGYDLTIADRWYPSSKTCSGCGNIDANLTLADRTYRCGNCGLEIDRDVNAAVNLARWQPPATSGRRPEALPQPVAA